LICRVRVAWSSTVLVSDAGAGHRISAAAGTRLAIVL
jgi:hypothetical protein